MIPETLKALTDSIAHHERVLKDRYCEELGVFTCALCRRFLGGRCSKEEEPCPVAARTGQLYCRNSPYFVYYKDEAKELGNLQFEESCSNKQFKIFEKKEVDFLKSLLPKEKE